MDKDKGTEEFEEVEITLSDRETNLLERLVSEGKFESMSDAAIYATEILKRKELEGIDSGFDPRIENRINQLDDICYSSEKRAAAVFFADTTMIIDSYEKFLYNNNAIEKQMEIGGILAGINEALGSDMASEDMSELFDGLEHYVNDFEYRVSGDTVYNSVIQDYKDKYFPLEENVGPFLR